MKLLIKAEIDYADEFYCEMFTVMTPEQWEDLRKKVSDFFEQNDGEEHEVYFGTNEQLIFSSYQQWLKLFTVTEIDDSQAKFLEENFALPFGTGSGVFLAEYFTIED